MTPNIAARMVSAGYSGVPAIHDVEIEVFPGEMVLLAGPNGAGKSTTVMTLAGANRPLKGHIEQYGKKVSDGVHHRIRAGVGLVMEGRDVFMGLTVAENLRLRSRDVEARALDYFPELTKLLRTKAGLISGGEQQMLSVGRVMGARPRIILADELSLGLAPIVVRRLLAALRDAADSGAAVLIVEQHVQVALGVVDRGYFIRQGRIELSGSREFLQRSGSEIRKIYL